MAVGSISFDTSDHLLSESFRSSFFAPANNFKQQFQANNQSNQPNNNNVSSYQLQVSGSLQEREVYFCSLHTSASRPCSSHLPFWRELHKA